MLRADTDSTRWPVLSPTMLSTASASRGGLDDLRAAQPQRIGQARMNSECGSVLSRYVLPKPGGNAPEPSR